MSRPSPPLIGAGRAADVFDLGDGTVLRRYRTDHDSAHEARLMQWLHSVGYPVPRVHRANGRDLVMDRIEGPTMLDDMSRRPWRLRRNVRLLVDLQRTLGELSAPDWLITSPGVPAGDAVLHLDLHPGNVLLSANGPVVIDWPNASRGPAGFDAALTHVLLSTSQVRRHERVAQLLVVAFFSRGQDPDYAHHMAAAIQRRLLDRNITARERASLLRHLERIGR